jgi:parallel beta-helix repeat protein
VSRDGRRRRRLTVGLLVLAGAGLLGTAAGLVLAHTRAPAERGRYAVRQVEGSERVELLAGRIDLPALAEALASDGRADILARRDGAWLLTRTLTVRRGASLTVGRATLRLLSEPRRLVGLEARGGRLEILDSTVTSWAVGRDGPDAEVGDGRAWVLARDGSVMNVRNSRMELLGYDRAERYGVSWRTKATSGAIDRSVFTGNFYGAYMHGVAAMRVTGSVIEKSHRYGLDPHSGSRNLHIEGNIFRHNGKHGMILAVGCSNATVRGNQSYANAGHGIVVFEGSNDATLSGNEVHDNKLSGIDVNNSLRLRLTGNVVYGNDIGLHVHGRSRSVVADANRLTANRADGLRVATGASAVTASRNLIDFNHRAGVFVAEGTARIGPANRLLDNEMGVWLSSDAAGTAVLDNSIEANILDGVHLAGLRVGQVRGNTIRANRKAAFSVATRGTARLFLAANRLAGNPEEERVRVEGHPQPTG